MITSFTFTQASPAGTWNIVHNLGEKVVSDVLIDVNGVRTKVNPEAVIHISDDELQVDFTSASAGIARLVAYGLYSLPAWTWIPDNVSIPSEYPPFTLLTENNDPLQLDPGGEYLEADV